MNGSQTILKLKKIITEFRKNIKESPPERRPKLKESLKIMKRTLKRQKEQLQLEKKLSKEHEKNGLLAFDLLQSLKRDILMSEAHKSSQKKEEKKKKGESGTIPLKLFSTKAKKVYYDYLNHIKNN